MYYRSNGYEGYRLDSRISQIYEMRRSKDPVLLLQAWERIRSMYEGAPDDDDIIGALAWVGIDMCWMYIKSGEREKAAPVYDIIHEVDYSGNDLCDNIESSIERIRLALDPSHAQIMDAGKLSKEGKVKEAFDKAKGVADTVGISEDDQEAYGWIIYMYLQKSDGLDSHTIRSSLNTYMNLSNPRPSNLHSAVLGYAVNLAKTDTNFKFDKFFKLWGPSNLREEDLEQAERGGKKYPPLFSRVAEVFVEKGLEADIEFIASECGKSVSEIADFFRERYYWKLWHIAKEEKSRLWPMLNRYLDIYSSYPPSEYHSRVLDLADRNAVENDSGAFARFAYRWDDSFMDEDWEDQEGSDGKTYPPLVKKVLTGAFKSYRSIQCGDSEIHGYLYEMYEKAANVYANDDTIQRNLAKLYIATGEKDKALEKYKALARDFSSKSYIWKDLSELVDGSKLKIAILSKFFILQREENMMGDARLKMAEAMIAEGMLAEAATELEQYKVYRNKNAWNIPNAYDILSSKLSGTKSSAPNNKAVYARMSPDADEFIFGDIPWQDALLTDKMNKNGKIRCRIEGDGFYAHVSENRFPILKKMKPVSALRVKVKPVSDDSTDSSGRMEVVLLKQSDGDTKIPGVEEKVCFISNVNSERGMMYLVSSQMESIPAKIGKDSHKFATGDFVLAEVFTRPSNQIGKDGITRPVVMDMKDIDRDEALKHFKYELAVVDGVNAEKKLFHFVSEGGRKSGVVHYEETSLRPTLGDFVEVCFNSFRNKEGIMRITIIDAKAAEEGAEDRSIRREYEGPVSLKGEDSFSSSTWKYGFAGDYYIDAALIRRHGLTPSSRIKAYATRVSIDRWKIAKITEVD